MAVRVIRLIEITYPDQAAFEADRERWQLPANGSAHFGLIRYKTAVLDGTTLGTIASQQVPSQTVHHQV